ncbi:tRNA lysidine(34) synthetase TilS [Sulfurimonas sp. SAG-AH-194-I05]|nr:tRNA lysidine(34) synthetase TilS [Sulfurimonas sp. SAG-AH-194-I05]MDF1875000.1 tRNA lysidine(34) synthetase TilS [Sulfurimonas sp. SAG-AH-194-I05]
MLKESALQQLRGKKNLLAFSAGGDSTALFFLLTHANIPFDIAIVDYGIREQSKEELLYAQELARKYNCTCHNFKASKITTNFEAQAREIRYTFFHALVVEFSYENILTAHHLGDRFEWMLMQFCKGAGAIELAGMQEIQKEDNYTLLRPLLHIPKEQLLAYLHTNSITYFEDETNLDESIKRNYFRHTYAKPLLQKYSNGIQKSFQYLDEDKNILTQNITLTTWNSFAYFLTSSQARANIYTIDKYLKKNLHMLSFAQREVLKEEKTVVIGRKFLICTIDKYTTITPYIKTQKSMDKEFKEECRKLKIEPKIRPFLEENKTIFFKLKELLNYR